MYVCSETFFFSRFSLFVCYAMCCKTKLKALKTFKMENLENLAMQIEECIWFWNGIACFYFCWIRKAFVILNKFIYNFFLYFVDIMKHWMCLAFSPCINDADTQILVQLNALKNENVPPPNTTCSQSCSSLM